MEELWSKVNYTAGISYITNSIIYELDIRQANINVLFEAGLIDEPTYTYLSQAERMVRQVYVGMLQRNSQIIVEALKSGIIEAKRKLFEANQIEPYQVLSIKNDAVFLINTVPSVRDFGMIHFIPKHRYTGYYSVMNYEFFYYYNAVTQEETLDVKGVGNIKPHEQYFYQFLKDLFYTVQVNGINIALRLMKQFYNQYIQRLLPVGYYRKFDPSGLYHFSIKSAVGAGFATESATEDQKPYLDISFNLRILLELQKILMSMYFNKH